MNEPQDVWQLYALLTEIEQRLTDAGESAWAARLRHAVSGGPTAGEILDSVGQELQALLATDVAKRARVVDEVESADRFVSTTLGPA